MKFDFNPFLRFISKTTYFIDDNVIANDSRMLYILSGKGTFECNGATYPLFPDTLLYYPPAVQYRIRAEEQMCFYTVNFDFTREYNGVKVMIPSRVYEFDSEKVLHTVPQGINVFENVLLCERAVWAEGYFEKLYSEAACFDEVSCDMQETLLKALLIEIYRNSGKKDSHGSLCDRIKTEIKKDLGANIRELAERLNYHPYYLNEVFREGTGISLHKYINKQRLVASAELLSTTSMSLDGIATVCGFSSQAHFSTSFKKEYKMSPREFRRLV